MCCAGVTYSNVSPVVPGSAQKIFSNVFARHEFVLDELCCVRAQFNVSRIWIRHLEESRYSDIKSNQLLQMSHHFLEQKCNVKSKSLWLQRYCGPTRKLLFLGSNPSRCSLNPSSAAAGGRTAPLIVRSASYGCCSLDSHLDSFVFDIQWWMASRWWLPPQEEFNSGFNHRATDLVHTQGGIMWPRVYSSLLEFCFDNKNVRKSLLSKLLYMLLGLIWFILLKFACFAEPAGLNGEFCINWDRDVWKHQMNIWENQSETCLSWFKTLIFATAALMWRCALDKWKTKNIQSRRPCVDQNKIVLWWLSFRPQEAIIIIWQQRCITGSLKILPD